LYFATGALAPLRPRSHTIITTIQSAMASRRSSLRRHSFLALALALVPQLCASQATPTVAVLAVKKPDKLFGNHAAYFATFSHFPLPKERLYLRTAEDEYGCTAFTADTANSWVGIVERGQCTFIEKARLAQEAGAKGIIIVSNDQSVQLMGAGNSTEALAEAKSIDIFVLGVDHALGQGLINATVDSTPEIEVAVYESNLLNISELILICLATSLVALGAFFSTADVSLPGISSSPSSGRDVSDSLRAALAPQDEEVLEVGPEQAIGFCFMGSIFLVVLFYFMSYLIYAIIGAFCIGGASCLAQFGAICLNYYIPSLRSKGWMVPAGVGWVAQAEVIAGLPAIAIVITWVVLRNTSYGWPLQDIIGAGFLCWLQRTLRLNNMKVASVLLSVMFFFDIFWVFISPLFFHESVMVRVATGGGTGESVPMLLRIPTLGDPFGGDRLLGFGDIALPGLLVSYLRRHDLVSGRGVCQGYFGPALIGYFVGLNCTIAALCIMHMGQPALLYLVPGTLGTTLVISLCRGELGLLWEGKAAPVRLQEDEESSGGPSSAE